MYYINIAEVIALFYKVKFDRFPSIHKFYTVVRNTVWGITDPEHILIIVTDGKCSIKCDNESYTVGTGEAFFVPAGHYYERRPIDDTLCTMHYLHFTLSDEVILSEPAELAPELEAMRQRIDSEIIMGDTELSYPNDIYIQSKTVFSDFDTIESLLRGLTLFSSKRQLMCNLRASINLSAILSVISQSAVDALMTDSGIHASSTIPPNLKKAISYITRHYSEQISLDELAAYCCISKQQLIRSFRQALNTTPIKYINDYKLARAKELLFNSPNLQISEIAAELGFGSQYYFTKLFTKYTGETPSAYRFRTVNYDKIQSGEKSAPKGRKSLQ